MKDIIIFGASGMVGDLVLRRALGHDDIGQITAVSRSPLVGYESPWLKKVVVHDFREVTASEIEQSRLDICFYCAGVYAGAVSRPDYENSTVTPLTHICKTLHLHHPGLSFCYLSEYYPLWAPGFLTPYHLQIRRRLEKKLINQAFGKLHIFKPSYVYPVEPRHEPTPMSRLKRSFYKVAQHGVTSYQLADAMLAHALKSNRRTYLYNEDILNIIPESNLIPESTILFKDPFLE